MAIKFYGKSQDVTQAIIERFKSGDVPAALAQVFVNRSDNIPSGAWSWRNRFIQAIHGTADARGFKQWKDAGRSVSKGSKAFYILGPCLGKRENDAGDTVPFIYGFKSIPVFALESTEVIDAAKWDTCSGVDTTEENRLQCLPLADVARAWDLHVRSYNGKGSGTLGYYKHSETIALGTENLSTWTHELIHAADDRLGSLVKKKGQDPSNEIVAELGGAVVLRLLGKDIDADLGGAWDYVKSYSKDDADKALTACTALINRVCAAVDHIITSAEELDTAQAA